MNSIGFFIVSVLVLQNSLADFPAGFEKCKAGDTTCIAKVTTDFIQKNPNGNSDLGLPKLEPLHINKLVISEGGGSGGLNLKLDFQDVDILGLSKVTVDKIEGFTEDAETSKFELSAIMPALTIKGKYSADGQILILPIQGKGDADLILDNVRISAKYKPTVNNQNGKIHLGVKKLKVKVEPSRMRITMQNLFNGDKALGDNMNMFLNENWKDIWTEVSPAINDAITAIINNMLSSVFKKITYDEFYLKE